METKEKETELVQLVRQLRDYVILDRKDYEKLVHNSSPEKFNESALESRDAQKVIIENSRGLRLGFFIELAEYFIFFLFLNCYVCIKTRNSKIHTPGLQIQIRIPPSSLSRHKPVHLQQVAGIMPN